MKKKLIFLIALYLIAGCNLTGTTEDKEKKEEIPDFPPELVRFDFYLADDTITVGKPFVVRGVTTSDVYTPYLEEPLDITLSTNTGEQATINGLEWWDFMSDEELIDLINLFKKKTLMAVIGAKETDEERGFASCEDGGERIVSVETIEMLSDWVNQKEGIHAYREPGGYRINVTFKEIPTANQLREIRDHSNFWYLIPATGHFVKALPAKSQENDCDEWLRDAAKLFYWRDLEELLSIEPGMQLTASYEQPDGSTIEASVEVVE